MKKKLFFSSVLLTLILVFSIAAAVGLSTSKTESNSNQIINSGTGSMVYVNVPPSTVTSSLPWHPSDIQLRCYDYTDSPLGPYDLIMVYLWIPQRNSYTVVALITDAPNTVLYQNLWYKMGFVWRPDLTPQMLNVIQVEDKDLEIWTEHTNQGNGLKGGAHGTASNVFIVNFTKADGVKINLPFSSPAFPYGDLTFTLPPLTLKFREIADSYYDEGANTYFPSSGYYRQPISEMRTPAWVEETIPKWLGATSPLEVVGHIDWHFREVITPPTPAP
jgi:hypothetical protein